MRLLRLQELGEFGIRDLPAGKFLERLSLRELPVERHGFVDERGGTAISFVP